MSTVVNQVFRFAGEHAVEQTTEFMVRILHVKGVESTYRTGNGVRVKFKDMPALRNRLSTIHRAVMQWAPKREYKPRKSA